jgi:hypothetical protein
MGKEFIPVLLAAGLRERTRRALQVLKRQGPVLGMPAYLTAEVQAQDLAVCQ